MNQTTSTDRRLHSVPHRDDVGALPASTGQRPMHGANDEPASKARWNEIRSTVLAILICAFLAFAVIVIRLVEFYPQFAQVLERTAQLLKAALPL